MASNYWAKLWIEMLDDRKTATLPDNLWRRFVECILLAKELNDDGRLPSIQDMAFRMRIEVETLEHELDALGRADLLDYRAENVLDGHWCVTRFEDRQGRMSGAERISRMRERTSKKQYRNDTVTKRYIEEETEEEKETDTETDTEYQILLTAFINYSKIPLFGGLKPRDNEALLNMIAAGCTPDDIKDAVEYAVQNGLTIVGPASIANGASIAAGKRKRVKPQVWVEEHR